MKTVDLLIKYFNSINIPIKNEETYEIEFLETTQKDIHEHNQFLL